ncbi:MAG: prepilin-type N-terminal cleavage/methylation domain-containing protein [Pseudomonadota bacterium]
MQKRTTHGFTLMEVIGVLAVIAIIASIAAPQIFQAIKDARLTGTLQQANDLRTAVARYYKDTGRWPTHYPTSNTATVHQLMRNGANVNGWDGPYLEQELFNELSPGSNVGVFYSSSDSWTCDLDGDGNQDGEFVVFRLDGVTSDIAIELSDMMDNDGSQTAEDAKNWADAGRVRHRSNNVLSICLARV